MSAAVDITDIGKGQRESTSAAEDVVVLCDLSARLAVMPAEVALLKAYLGIEIGSLLDDSLQSTDEFTPSPATPLHFTSADAGLAEEAARDQSHHNSKKTNGHEEI